MKKIGITAIWFSSILSSDFFSPNTSNNNRSHPYNGPIEFLIPLNLDVQFDFDYLKQLCKQKDFCRLNQLFLQNKIITSSESKYLNLLTKKIKKKIKETNIQGFNGILSFLLNQ